MNSHRLSSDTAASAIWDFFRFHVGWASAASIKANVTGWTDTNVHYAIWALVADGLLVAKAQNGTRWIYQLAPVASRPRIEASRKRINRKVERRERAIAAT